MFKKKWKIITKWQQILLSWEERTKWKLKSIKHCDKWFISRDSFDLSQQHLREVLFHRQEVRDQGPTTSYKWCVNIIISTCSVVKNPQCRRQRRHGFSPWVGKIPWRRAWQPTPGFLPAKSHGQRSLVGYSPWGYKELDTTEWLTHTHKSELLFRVPGT